VIKIFKKPVIIALIIVVILAVYFLVKKPPKPAYDIAVAQKGNLTQIVSVTGQVKAEEKIDLAFEKGGRISSINVKVGDKVSPGQILIQLANADVAAQLAQAQADVDAQQAKLNELIKGTRPEEIQIQEAKVANAEVTLENSKRDLVDKLNDAYTKSDDGVRNKTDQIFTNPRTVNPQLSFSTDDFNLKIKTEIERFQVENTLVNWKTTLDKLTASSDLNSYLTTAKNNIDQVKNLLDDAALALNGAKAAASVTQTMIDGWKTDVYTARSNLNTAIVNLSDAENAFKSAQSDLIVTNQELNLDRAGSTPEQIAAQEAEVEQAKANAQNYQAQLAKTILRSPLTGIVTKQDGNVGEIIAANTPLVSLISENKFKIEANIPETDIAKVKVGDSTTLTLDAYGNEVIFEASVIAIDPAETIIEGVSTYKTTFEFKKEDERIKPGMTANIDILTDKRENVIVVPQRTVIGKNNERTVKILNRDGSIKEISVEVGLKGSDGNVEIIKGINEGDKVTIWH